VVLGVVLAGALLVADANYAAVRTSPRISYETLASPQTRGLAVVDAPRLRDFIERQFLSDVPVPGWVLPLALPHEAALVVDADYAGNSMDLTMFVNDKRLQPVILDQLNGIELPAPLNQWFTRPATAEGRGKIIRKGGTTLNRTVLARVEELWGGAQVSDSLQAKGGHMLEVVLDNRDGGAVAMLASIAVAQGVSLDELSTGRLGVIKDVASLRIQADLLPDDTAKLLVEIESVPGADPNGVTALAFFLDMGLGFAQKEAHQLGVKVSGGSQVKGTTIEGDYTISNLGPLLAMI